MPRAIPADTPLRVLSDNDTDTNSKTSTIANESENPFKGQQQQEPQLRGKFANRERYLILFLLSAVSYLLVIYQSLEVAGTNEDGYRVQEKLQDPLPGSGGPTDNATASAIKNTNSRSNILKPIQSIGKKTSKELRLPKPVINVGFPKAGTSSIFSFFHCNGLKSQHWFCCEPQDSPKRTKSQKLMSKCLLNNLVDGRPFFQNCGDYEVYSEINGPRHFPDQTLLDNGKLLSKAESMTTKRRLFFPQHHRLDAIHKEYPNATLVLNNRPVEKWIVSVQSWNAGLKYEILNEFYEQNSTRFLFENITNGTNIRPLFNSRNMLESLKAVYKYHQEYIRDWVERHPSHALVEVDITHEDAGKTFAEAFGLKESCWGHENKGTEKRTSTTTNKRSSTIRKRPIIKRAAINTKTSRRYRSKTNSSPAKNRVKATMNKEGTQPS